MAQNILWLVIGLVLGAIIGFFVCRKVMADYLKKNPPINEDMIKTLMLQMLN